MTVANQTKLVRLHFHESSNWSRWYSTNAVACYLGKSDASMRSWVRRYRSGKQHFVKDGIEVRRHGGTWLFRFDRSWESEVGAPSAASPSPLYTAPPPAPLEPKARQTPGHRDTGPR